MAVASIGNDSVVSGHDLKTEVARTRHNQPVCEACSAVPLSALLGCVAAELDVTEGVDAGVEGAADDGRGLVFDDNGGTGNNGAGLEVAAVVDCDLDEFACFWVEDGANARRLG